MPRIVFPYILTLAVFLFVLGLYGGLTRRYGSGPDIGTFLMCAGIAAGGLGFTHFLPEFFIKPWMGYAIVLFALMGMMRETVKEK